MKLETKKMLVKYNIRPSKKLGQNFLVEKGLVNKLLAIAQLKPRDFVLEVGPGLGSLTLPLASKVKQVIAVEKDRDILTALEKILEEKAIKNVQLVHSDILKCQIQNPYRAEPSGFRPKSQIPNKSKIPNLKLKTGYKLVANLPYNIATAVVMKFLTAKNPPELLVVLLQKEVAERMLAQPPRMNKLAIFGQLFGRPKLLKVISKNNFFPKPKVDSALLKITDIQKNLPKIDLELFSQIVKAGFSQPRKQLINNLSELNSHILKKDKKDKDIIKKWLTANKVEPEQRAETLFLGQWAGLTATCPFNK